MIFIDANIFMYAAGKEHQFKSKCLKFLSKVAQSGSTENYCTNTEVLQEILHRYRSLRRDEIGFEIFNAVLALNINILPIELMDISLAKRLLSKHKNLSTRDAVHLGVMIRNDIDTIVSYDSDFDGFSDIRRMEPK